MHIEVFADGTLAWNGRRVQCALGRAGIRAAKREGDGATPAGRFALRRVLYRADRVARPETDLDIAEIGPDDGWCDDPHHPAYNRPVRLPHAGHHERLWRDDGLYDLLVVLGHNDDPPTAGMGSAIFLHVAAPDYVVTEGCVALALEDLQDLLRDCCPGAEMTINPPAA